MNKPKKFRKKPVVIDAIQLNNNLHHVCQFIGGENGVTHIARPPNSLSIFTLEGEMQAVKSDWIIKGVKGEFYPCKPDIFEKTYEPAE